MSVMKLKKFRVKSFRSVEDSGWIEIDNVGSFIGVNESGKSNLLLPLWKFNPAKDGKIDPIADYPRAKYNEIRAMETKPTYIETVFENPPELIQQLVDLTKADPEELTLSRVDKHFGGTYYVSFPNQKNRKTIDVKKIESVIKAGADEIKKMPAVAEGDADLKSEFAAKAKSAFAALVKAGTECTVGDANIILEMFNDLESDEDDGGEASVIEARINQFLSEIEELNKEINAPPPGNVAEARQLVVNNLPKFVYYSHYGNLDSEIYLPHVIANMERTDLGAKEEAKARTLKVLFDFVNLQPNEILELGKEVANPNAQQIEENAKKKREREILLQSASTKLTHAFKDWWKQGNYVFRFSADGNHFRIWVSDEKRPEPIELENRSTGLQWFLSFFLVFLVEAEDEHESSILLLDEPGLTLHPLAQRDLSAFFDNLSENNQLLFSTHSPFMVDADKLDRVRAVYSDENGKTKVSADLRSTATKSVQSRSIYAAHAALGLTVSDVILQGCVPVIVEGQSDQFYLAAVKNYLQGKGLLKVGKEIVFVPGGGTKSIRIVASILAAKEDQLPIVLLDSDKAGLALAKSLQADLYAGQKEKVMTIQDLTKEAESEVEDFMPKKALAAIFAREWRGKDEDFDEILDEKKPIVGQMEAFAKANGHELHQGWKVDLARSFKKKSLSNVALLEGHKAEEHWIKLFTTVAEHI